MTKSELEKMKNEGLYTRSFPVTVRESATAGEVDVIATTEAPAKVFDWERWEVVDEVLMMNGFKIRAGQSVPFLDSHSRNSVEDVLGTFSAMKINGDKLEGTVKFATDEKSQRTLEKFRGGHLTDVSVGYRVTKSVFVEEGTKADINGRSFVGPLKVSTEWVLQELSAVPIGADPNAVAKSVREVNMINNLSVGSNKMSAKIKTEDEIKSDVEATEVARKQEIADATAKAVAQDRERVAEIRAIAEKTGVPSADVDSFIRSGLTVDQARSKMLDFVVAQKESKAPASAHIEVVKDAGLKFREAAIDGIMLRANMTKSENGRELAGFSLVELAREQLRQRGENYKGSSMDVVQRALTTSDFPIILSNVANKSLMMGFETAPATWRIWCGVGRLEDFKQATIAKLGASEGLEEVKEHGEFKHSSRSEDKEVVTMSTFGRIFGLSRQAIINDDLGAFTTIPQDHGESAQRKLSDIAYAILTVNANMNDGVPLFNATHKNVGSTGSVSVTTIGEAVALMKRQTDISGLKKLMITPRYFIGPVSIETSTEQFFRSSLSGLQATPNLINPFAGDQIIRVYDPRLDDTGDLNAWYMAAEKGKTVTMYFLQGNEAPMMETRQGFEVDGVEWKVRLDAVAKAVDHRGLVYNAG